MKLNTSHYALSLLAMPLVISCGTGSATKEKNNKLPKMPNVVFIYADDIGFGDLSCNGSTTISTPNVDRLAAKGIRFTNLHSTAATSTPSRYALLTGEYAWRREGTGIATGDAAMVVTPDRYTLADLFNGAGYTTGAVGKWHLGLGDKTGTQNWNDTVKPNTSDIGFNYSYIMAATGDRVPCIFMENGKGVNLDPNDPISVSYTTPFEGEPTGAKNPELLTVLKPSHGHDQTVVNGISRIGYMKGGKSALWLDENIADTITAKAVQFIERHQKEPFFLYFATNDAHVPRVPHPRFKGKSGLGARGDALLAFDWSVGEVLNTLERLGLEENTIIILTSDNGPVVDDGYQDMATELLGNHKPWGPYRGGKYSIFEAGTRVPCILAWKGIVTPGTSNALLSQIDLFSSFASLLNVQLPKGAAPDSQNLLDTWLGADQKGREYFVAQNLNNTLAISTNEWKYIEPSKGPAIIKYTNTELGNNPNPQLYNLIKDEAERNNCIAQNPEIAKQLAAKLEEIKQNK